MNATASTKSRRVPVIEYLYSIIDTKIQYINYCSNELTKEFSDEVFGEKVDDDLLELQAFVFSKLEKFTRSKKLLLSVRFLLNANNTKVVYQLLSNDLYLRYSEMAIQELLEKSSTSNFANHKEDANNFV